MADHVCLISVHRCSMRHGHHHVTRIFTRWRRRRALRSSTRPGQADAPTYHRHRHCRSRQPTSRRDFAAVASWLSVQRRHACTCGMHLGTCTSARPSCDADSFRDRRSSMATRGPCARHILRCSSYASDPPDAGESAEARASRLGPLPLLDPRQISTLGERHDARVVV